MKNISQEDAERLMRTLPDAERLRKCSKHYSAKPHLAGDRAHAEQIAQEWRSRGIATELVQYDVLQNFPVSASLRLLQRDDGGAATVAFEAGLTEHRVPEDETSDPANGLPLFHGFGANGRVEAELVYANFGTRADFLRLEEAGVRVRGCVVICKYGKVFRGLKVRAAEMAGAVGVIIYSDPQEDGVITVANGYAAYPDGPARRSDCVQRGSVDFFSVGVGDPTTPGWPSLPGDETERRDPWKEGTIPKIPSLPISYGDALPFLRALNGLGLSPEDVCGKEGDWRGGLEEVSYHTGPSVMKASLSCESDYRYSPIYNVIGTIEGRTSETVVLGSHHDAWSCGAVDPVSGSAALNEVVRGLGRLLKMGWEPYRKLIIASWDNEEYGLVGSTEFGEEHAEELKKNCVAYINVDESTNGGFVLGAVGSPLLTDILTSVMKTIPSPLTDGRSVYVDWLKSQDSNSPMDSPMEIMGTGSDYTVFFHHLGIPSIDMVFNGRSPVVYPYHSNYDSYYWMQKFGDPGFKKHLAMARLWGVMTVRLAGVPVLGFKGRDYASALRRHVEELKGVAGLDLGPLERALDPFAAAMTFLDRCSIASQTDVSGSLKDDFLHGSLEINELNRRYRMVEKSFLLEMGHGLPGRPWYRHMVFAPGLWAGYDGVAFPGMVESIEANDIGEANKWVTRISCAIDKATAVASGRVKVWS